MASFDNDDARIIDKFNGWNFNIWKFKIKMLLANPSMIHLLIQIPSVEEEPKTHQEGHAHYWP